MKQIGRLSLFTFVAGALAGAASMVRAGDPLPSWNDGSARTVILEFVAKVTTAGSPNFVPVPERVATFDNDGTLWAEQPTYVQFLFAIDRVKALAPQHPEWKRKEPFASLLKGDLRCALSGDERLMRKTLTGTARCWSGRKPAAARA